MRLRQCANGLSVLLLLGCYSLTVIRYSSLPLQIPAHFNLKGSADAYAHRSSLWMPLIIATVLWLLLLLLQRYPHRLTYPLHLPELSKAQIWRKAQELIALQGLLLVLLFGSACLSILLGAAVFPLWLLPVTVLLSVGLIVYFFVSCRQLAGAH